jgi:putative SOS response-associated peptidase YedK
MCGRYALYGPKSVSRAEKDALADGEHRLIQRFIDRYLEGFPPRYNIAPQQGNPANYVPVLRMGADGQPEIVPMQWWLLPHWSKQPRVRYTSFIARVEGVAEAASFRVPFRRRRCLIPATGWYEWQELPTGNLPWFVYPRDGETALLAGVWDRWEGDGKVVESCSIITGEANATISRFHDRMPFPLPAANQDAWLDPTLTDANAARELLQPVPAEAVAAHRVDKRVNNARNTGPALVEPLTEEDPSEC